MLSKEGYSAIFEECILKKPSRLPRPDSCSAVVQYPTPTEVVDRQHSGEMFMPSGIIPGSGKFYETYIPMEDSLLRKDVVVARDPGFPLQRIVGPEVFVDQIMLGLFYLKNFFGENHPFHHMDLIASNSYSVTEPYDVKSDGYLWTNTLLEKLSIEKMRSKYSKYSPWNQEKPHVGIRRDIPWPVFFMQYSKTNNPSEENEMAIKQASNIVHDFTHYLLSLYGYQSTGSVAERICLTNQATFLEAIYCNSSGLFGASGSTFEGWTVGRDKNMPEYIKRLISYINDYRSGGSLALIEANKSFGYKLPKVNKDAKYPAFRDFR